MLYSKYHVKKSSMSICSNPQSKSWLTLAADSDFPIQNIPFGILKHGQSYAVASIIGDQVINLAALAKHGVFDEIVKDSTVFSNQYLNPFIALGKSITNAIREKVAEIMEASDALSYKAKATSFLTNVDKTKLCLPIDIKDYTDFYSSKEHAYNVGCLFRDPENALLPNWKHLPVGYHGRASSIIVSGTDIKRPSGQSRPDKSAPPIFGKSRLMDFELEMGFVIGKETNLGDTVSTSKAEDYIFGMSLFNDWSARDIQGWEYVPLGPFLGKNFASTLSPWIITLEALAPFRTSGPKQDPEVFEYLQYEGDRNFDIHLEAIIRTEAGVEKVVAESNHKYLYWNICQQLAHHTINGCNINVGDLYASGTISGPEEGSYGSMLEISWKGTKPVQMPDGTERKFINNNDTVILKGYCEKDGLRIGFGEASGKIIE